MSNKFSNDYEKQDSLQPDFRAKLGRRIDKVILLFRTKKEAAKVAGVTTEQVRSYTNGNSKPPFEVLARLAIVKNVNLNWLATGEKEMMIIPSGVTEMNEDLLQTVVEKIEVFLYESDLSWPPDKKARVIAAGYDTMLSDSGKGESKDFGALSRLLKAAV